MNSREAVRTGWRCQLRVRIPEASVGAGEIARFRRELDRLAAEHGLSTVSVQAVAVAKSVSLVVESASAVEELTEAVALTERLVRQVGEVVWPTTAAGSPARLRMESVAARRL